MLPSTGYFHGINCPFYDNGLCDRPYCHFRHVKRDITNNASERIESGAILQKLVSAAVQKVLQQKESSTTAATVQPTSSDSVQINPSSIVASSNKATYNPTPISELNKINNADIETVEGIIEQRKRHIPVPYTPRKPASIPIKRLVTVDSNGSKPFIYIPPPLEYTPGSTDNIQNDKYTPAGTVENNEKYLPGTEKELQEYTPDPSTQDTSSKRNYVPSSDKTVPKKNFLEYKPVKVSAKTHKPSVTYQPTPRSLAPCFSSDEEEPDTKKAKLSGDLNEFDNLGPEFDILDQILDEEKLELEIKGNMKKDKSISTESKKSVTESKKQNGHSSKTESTSSETSLKSHYKISDETKKSSSSEEKNKKQKIKQKEKDKHSSHKSSNKDREKVKQISEKKKPSTKSSHSSKHSKHSSPKKLNSEKHTDSIKSKSKDRQTKDKTKKNSKHKDKHKSKEESKHLDSDSCSMADNGYEEFYEMSEDDEDTIALECRKIFEEYVPEKPKTQQEILNPDDINETPDVEYVPGKKRISRTVDKNIKVIPRTPIKPDFKLSAAQAMAERLAKVREFHNSKQENFIINNPPSVSAKIDIPKNSAVAGSSGSTKIRIAHVPYASTLLHAKKTIPPPQPPKNIHPSGSTISQTIKKGEQRVAHVPCEKFIDRPGVLEPLASKIAANIRSTYLNMMIDECLKLYIHPSDAYARAQNEELATSKKCSTVQIYKNSAVMAVSRLRKELQECNGVKKSGIKSSVPGKESTSGNSNTSGSWSIVNKNRNVTDNSKEFIGARFFNNIKKWILTEEQLQSNGFPRPHASGEKGRAIIYGQNKQKPPKGFIRTCCRCKKDYTVNKRGLAAVKEECIYHPNNKYRVRGEARYQCCSQDGTSDGCCVAPSHVYEYVDFENLKGFVKTLPPERTMDDYGVYSLDCEMCYTTQGLDLTRVTVINSSCKVVYETLIKPLHPIVDYNTRYSGITEEQMATVKTTLLEVQATLLTMFNSKTILVGHSLESDFKALKLIHDTVIDTSVLFPHKMGPPYKRALRNLSSEHLKKIIQNSVDGHDSAEDAMVCMELLHYKLKEDLKTR